MLWAEFGEGRTSRVCGYKWVRMPFHEDTYFSCIAHHVRLTNRRRVQDAECDSLAFRRGRVLHDWHRLGRSTSPSTIPFVYQAFEQTQHDHGDVLFLGKHAQPFSGPPRTLDMFSFDISKYRISPRGGYEASHSCWRAESFRHLDTVCEDRGASSTHS